MVTIEGAGATSMDDKGKEELNEGAANGVGEDAKTVVT